MKKISVGKIIAVFFGIVFVFLSIGMLFGGTAIIVINETLSDSEGGPLELMFGEVVDKKLEGPYENISTNGLYYS